MNHANLSSLDSITSTGHNAEQSATHVRHKSRIASVDGLRAVAVLGVIWAHLWAFGFACAPLSIGAFDLHRALSILGTGVDLFFVISGLFMYLVFLDKIPPEGGRFRKFVFRRWLRIAPAYYAAAAFCAVVMGVTDIYSLLAHAFFLHTVLPGVKELAAFFWSIATEMHFYLLLPLFTVTGSGKRMVQTTVVLLALSAAFGVWLSTQTYEMKAYWDHQLPSRLCEFCWGILIGLFYSNPSVKRTSSSMYLIAGVVLVIVGRSLMSRTFFNGTSAMQAIGSVGIPVLSGGYALVIWSVLQEQSILRKILHSKLFQLIGKYSYSLYLWHWIPSGWMASIFILYFGNNALSLDLCFIATLCVLIVISAVSYSCLSNHTSVTKSCLKVKVRYVYRDAQSCWDACLHNVCSNLAVEQFCLAI